MTSLAPASLMWRRVVPAAILAAAATFVSNAIGPTTASAERVWDIEVYDSCVEANELLYRMGDITTVDHALGWEECCVRSGGTWQTGQGYENACGAPPAIAASTPVAPPSEAANPDVPAGPPPTKPGPKPLTPKTSLTLAPGAPGG